jgi:hypothetical protein
MTASSARDDDPASTTPADPPAPAVTVREILDEARRVAGSGARLAMRLQELGIAPTDTIRYSESAISNWIRGRTMPPADVLVAASRIAGLPLVASRGSAAAAGHGLPSADLSAGLQHQIDALRASVIDLYGRLGYPMPSLDSSDSLGERRDSTASAG